jgi:hypothetical protein
MAPRVSVDTDRYFTSCHITSSKSTLSSLSLCAALRYVLPFLIPSAYRSALTHTHSSLSLIILSHSSFSHFSSLFSLIIFLSEQEGGGCRGYQSTRWLSAHCVFWIVKRSTLLTFTFTIFSFFIFLCILFPFQNIFFCHLSSSFFMIFVALWISSTFVSSSLHFHTLSKISRHIFSSFNP